MHCLGRDVDWPAKKHAGGAKLYVFKSVMNMYDTFESG